MNELEQTVFSLLQQMRNVQKVAANFSCSRRIGRAVMNDGHARQRIRGDEGLSTAVAKVARLENRIRWNLPGDDHHQDDDDGAHGETSFMLEPAH
jgi:hypothetical protein